MDDYGIPGSSPLDTPYGLTARRSPLLPAPVVPFLPGYGPVRPGVRPLPPMYADPGATGRMLRQAQPMMTALAGMSRRVADVLPFRPVRAFADATQAAATEAQKTPAPTQGTPSITPEQLTQWTRRAESSGNYTALNREKPGNTASGAYQYTDSTWNGYGGYSKAMFAPPEVQDRRYAEDIAKRLAQYGGDPFKAIAAHYLPAYANNPAMWQQKVRVGRTVVNPVANYVRHVIKGTPLEAQFNGYLARYESQ